MKRFFTAVFLIAGIMTLTACSNNNATNITEPSTSVSQSQENENNTPDEEGQDITLTFTALGEMEGAYSGDMVDGLPDGKGKFTSKNANGSSWYYEGDFKQGHFEGQGKTVWDSGQIQEGEYVNDIWHPNPLQYYRFIESLGDTTFQITDKAAITLEEHQDYFPMKDAAQGPEDAEMVTDHQKVYDGIADYGDKIIGISEVRVSKINSFAVTENPENLDELRCTYMTFIDGDKIYEMYYRGEVKDIQEGDTIKAAYGVPIGTDTLKMNDVPQNTVVLAGCYLEK